MTHQYIHDNKTKEETFCEAKRRLENEPELTIIEEIIKVINCSKTQVVCLAQS